MLRLIFTLALLVATPLAAVAAPMTVKEIDFLLRQRIPEAEITAQLTARRLLAPIDAAAEEQLRKNGASPALLGALGQEQYVLPPAEAQAYLARTAPARPAPGVPPPAPAPAAAPAPPRPPAPAMDPAQRHRLVEQLAGKLVQLEGDELRTLDASRLRDIRVFAFYSSAAWCGPCRKFTPQLIAQYKQLKARYPHIEIIFLSSDRDEFNMAAYMRSQKMPWPAVRFGAQAEFQQLYCGSSIPWLVCVASNGTALTKNGEDKQYIDPGEVLEAFAYLAAQVK